MSLIKNSILLLKAEKSEDGIDKYEEILTTNNFKVMQVKTLMFQYKNLDILREKLENPDDFSGIIFSSPRCVNATSQALTKEQLMRLWGSKAIFTVGEKTHVDALDKLGLSCKGKESGNAKNLAQVIIKESKNLSKPLLFPHGNLRTDTLKLELSKENIKLTEVLVYDTLPNPHIETNLEQVTDEFRNIPEFIVFFSPSGLHSSLPYLKQFSGKLDLAKIIAIGPVTELAIQQENLKVYSVAQNPTPESVLKSIM